DLDFPALPDHGAAALVEKPSVSKRSRRPKGVRAFLAPDADTRGFGSANAELRKAEPSDEVLRFVRFGKRRTGHYPDELIFDSQRTTSVKLDTLNQRGIPCITLRRRAATILEALRPTAPSAWRRIERAGGSRTSTHPRIRDRRVTRTGDDGPVRPGTVTDLGHDEPRSEE